jgi:hypothetical protein
VALGGHLVTINDAAQEGTFVWASGEPATYLHWYSGEPNNYGLGEDYGMIFPPTDVRAGFWNDADNFASVEPRRTMEVPLCGRTSRAVTRSVADQVFAWSSVPPQMNSPGLSNGAWHLQFNGTQRQGYFLQFSTNLSD